MNWIESLNVEKIKIRHSSKVKDDTGVIKTEEKKQPIFERKIIGVVGKNNPYVIRMGKTPEIMLELEKNYRLSRRVYQSLFVDIADLFIQYIQSHKPDEIKQLDDDIKVNG